MSEWYLSGKCKPTEFPPNKKNRKKGLCGIWYEYVLTITMRSHILVYSRVFYVREYHRHRQGYNVYTSTVT